MVLRGAVPGMGQTKRTSPSMPGADYPGWGAPPPMVMSRQGPSQLPFAHYAMIFMDDMGKVRVEESPSIRARTRTFFTPEDRERFLELIGAKVNYQRLVLGRPMNSGHRTSVKSDPVPLGGGFSFEYDPKLSQEGESGIHQWQSVRQIKRRKGSTRDTTLEAQYIDTIPDCPAEEVAVYPTMDRTALEIGDTEKVVGYYEMALKHFQQLNCRQMAKAFIKFIEPRKQVKHPYNGGRPPPGALPGEKGDPEKTKPEWWPSGVVHKEPDHLKKDQRLRLLVHIFRKLGKYGITSDKLKEVAHDAKRQIKPPERIEILDEIFRVRKLEERFERGEVDASTIVYVVNRDPNMKLDRDSDTFSEPDQQLEQGDAEDIEEGLLTPISSAEQAPGPLTSPINHMAVARQGRPIHMTDDRSQLFQMPPPLTFDESPRQPHPFPSPTSGIKADYQEDFSQTVSRTSASSTVVSPNEHTGFEYLAQTSFGSSASEEQIRQHQPPLPPQQPSAHFDAWSPGFQQNMFSSVDYGAGSNQAIQQQSMQFQLPMLPTSHPHDVSPHQAHIGHSLPDLHGARAQAAQLEAMTLNPPPFRTGSLSHPHVLPRPNGNESHMG